MITRLLLLTAMIGGSYLVAIPNDAAAQSNQPLTRPDVTDNPLSILRRPRPDYDAIGVPAGSFIIFPSIQVGEEYNSNIFATETGETSDFITTYAPSVAAVSDWNNHELVVDVHGNGGLYADNSGEDFFDYGAFLGGRLDVRRSTNLTGSVAWDRLHEDRGSPEDVNGDEQTEFDQFVASAGANTQQGRFSFGLDGEYTYLSFDDTTLGGMPVNNDDRNQEILEGTGRVGYGISPDYEVFLLGSYADITYDNSPDDAGVVRDNHGWRVDAGLAFAITETLVGDVYGGYIERTYDNPAFADTGSFDLGGDLYWSITPLTTARAVLQRNFVETTRTGASTILQTAGRVEVEHELLRNVILGAKAGLTNYDYEGISRNDDVWTFGANGRYLITRNFYAGGEAQYIDRDSNAPTESFDQIVVGVFVGAQM